MKINDPNVVAEVEAAFARYERALIGNDVATLTELSRKNSLTIRYEIAENPYGSDAIGAFRAARSSAGLARELSRTAIITYSDDFAMASTLFHRASARSQIGRRIQSWARLPEGWRVVAAHVSLLDKA